MMHGHLGGGIFRRIVIALGRRRAEIFRDLDTARATGAFYRLTCQVGFGLERDAASGANKIHRCQ